jgi:hypothetical protein
MNTQPRLQTTCGVCNAVLKAKPDLVGKRARCPKCGNAIEIPKPDKCPPKARGPLATDRRKEYARSLGIKVPDDMTRREVGKLIDEAVAARDEQRIQRLDDLTRRESEAWQKMRREIPSETDADNCGLSKADASKSSRRCPSEGLPQSSSPCGGTRLTTPRFSEGRTRPSRSVWR